MHSKFLVSTYLVTVVFGLSIFCVKIAKLCCTLRCELFITIRYWSFLLVPNYDLRATTYLSQIIM